MAISLSPNIDAPSCTACANRRPWAATVSAIEAKLKAHGVIWQDFAIIHGKYLSCADAETLGGMKDAGLYVVATDVHGVEAKHAKVFNRVDGHYVGVSSIIDDSAFKRTTG